MHHDHMSHCLQNLSNMSTGGLSFFFFFFFRLSCILADFWTPSVHLTCHGSKQLQDGTWQLEGKVLLKGGLYYRDEVS